MEQHHAPGEQQQAVIAREVHDPLQVECVVAPGGIARARVIDLVGLDPAERDQRRDAQDRGGEEDRAGRYVASEHSHERRGRGIAGGGEPVVSSDPQRHAAPADQPEADRRDGGADDAGGQAVQAFGREHHRAGRPQREQQCRRADHHDAHCGQCALPVRCVGERAAGNERRHADHPADRQGHADVLLRPSRVRQIECQERAEAHLHVGQEKIGPVEPAPALVGNFAIALPALPAVLRDDPSRTRGEAGEPFPNPGPLHDRSGCRTHSLAALVDRALTGTPEVIGLG